MGLDSPAVAVEKRAGPTFCILLFAQEKFYFRSVIGLLL